MTIYGRTKTKEIDSEKMSVRELISCQKEIIIISKQKPPYKGPKRMRKAVFFVFSA